MWADVGRLETEFEDLWSYGGLDDEAEVEPGEPPRRAIFYAPSTDCDRDGIVHRRPQSVFGCIALDFRGVDQEAEVEAFRRAFKPELETLADEIGKPPTFRWAWSTPTGDARRLPTCPARGQGAPCGSRSVKGPDALPTG